MRARKEELIEYVKPLLKEQGFRKKGQRWSKVTEHFTYMFFIQGSSYSRDDYYVRPGVIVNDIEAEPWVYGHFHIDIPPTTKEEIWAKAEAFFSRWSSIDYLKKTLIDFNEWTQRNPLEKRRTQELDEAADPVPAHELFTLSEQASEEILAL